jgi:hypothetical protein
MKQIIWQIFQIVVDKVQTSQLHEQTNGFWKVCQPIGVAIELQLSKTEI